MLNPNWVEFLEAACDSLISADPLAFATMTPSMVSEHAGVYLITARVDGREVPYYVGRTTNLRQRLYAQHLMGRPSTNARLKKYLIETGECADAVAAKTFIRTNCLVRWLHEADLRRRGALEGYLTGVLFPKHGISVEH